MITVRYFAGARAAAGTPEEIVPAGTLHQVLTTLGEAHGPRLARVLAASSYLVDGVTWHDAATPLPVGATIDILPPFAGG